MEVVKYGRSMRVVCVIAYCHSQHVLYREQVRHLQQLGAWPREFAPPLDAAPVAACDANVAPGAPPPPPDACAGPAVPPPAPAGCNDEHATAEASLDGFGSRSLTTAFRALKTTASCGSADEVDRREEDDESEDDESEDDESDLVANTNRRHLAYEDEDEDDEDGEEEEESDDEGDGEGDLGSQRS